MRPLTKLKIHIT